MLRAACCASAHLTDWRARQNTRLCVHVSVAKKGTGEKKKKSKAETYKIYIYKTRVGWTPTPV